MIIAITGPAGSGKSTAAQYLIERHGFTLVKFAGRLKSMMRALGLSDREIEGDLKEKPCLLLGGRTPRYAMQTLGTDWGRNLIHSNLWVNVAMAGVRAVLDKGGRVVIDDCRYENEADAVIRFGGVIAKIARPGVGPLNGHPSETTELAHNWLIANDSAVKDLHAKLDDMVSVEQYLKERSPCE